MAKYLKHFPKPLLDDLASGRWLPVVGAGMSLNAIVPAGKKMPLWRDLGQKLAEELEDFVPNSPLDAISAYEHEFGRARLVQRLSEILLMREAQPGEAHREFCSLQFGTVCTTNFDFLLERQYDLTPRYVYPVVDEEQLSIEDNTPGTLLLKLHGDLRHPSRLVVTEADYDGFLSRYPLLATYLSNQLITKTAVLIGYSLDDPDFRQLWHVVAERLGKMRRRAYALHVDARPSDIARFERRGVKVINLPSDGHQYGDVLAAAFRELREYVRENVISVSRVTEEEPLRELLLPRDAASRLCFFSLPLRSLPVYREHVFPAVVEAGLVPIAADDVISPGDNVLAKIDALIDRAAVMVCELTSPWTVAEYQMALARLAEVGPVKSMMATTTMHPPRPPLRLILVVTSREQIPPNTPDHRVIVRPEVWEEEPQPFTAELIKMLRDLASPSADELLGEARRLYAAKEYRASVIAALSALETILRRRFEDEEEQDKRRTTLGWLIELAQRRGLLAEISRDQIRGWLHLRNRAVHSGQSITRTQARTVLDGIAQLLGIE